MVETVRAESGRVAFRVDGGISTGAGHVVRCLALAERLRSLDWEVHFVCRAHEGHFGAQIAEGGFALHLLPATDASPEQHDRASELRWLGASWQHDAAQTAELLAVLRPAWLVVDHYGIDARWEEAQLAHAGQILAIDDLADRPHIANLLVDQNLQPDAHRYRDRVPPACRKLLGPHYALLRSEFAAQAARARHRGGPVKRILACVGGADPKNVLPTVVAAWAALGPGRPHLDIAVGAQTPNLARLRELCRAHDDCSLHVEAENMAELVHEADLLFCAGGSINWERCCLGRPAVLTQIASNQADNLRLLTRARTGVSVGDAQQLDADSLTAVMRRVIARPSLLRRLGERSARLVDGRGAVRVAIAMSAESLRLRPATAGDGEAAWAWRNAESTRRYFTDPRPIPLHEHLAWWRGAIAAGDRTLMIAQLGATAVGVVRLDRAPDRFTVSNYVDPALTGLGLGTRIIEAARRWARSRRGGPQHLYATIDERNHASRSAFAAAGFRPVGTEWVCEV